MAQRPVFVVNETSNNNFVDIQEVEFEWFPGFSTSQKQKSIEALHHSFLEIIENKDKKVLEVSTKSYNPIGVRLSAFNLKVKYKEREIFLENAFQASKVFNNGDQYLDLLYKSPREAKKDERLKNSGKLEKFIFLDTEWELEPKTLFYDWLYINAVNNNEELKSKIIEYNCFTDIEFNPKRSYNCQAYSAALFVALLKRELLKQSLENFHEYKKIIIGNKHKLEQGKLF